MTDSAARKVRLVRCPKCRQLLPESADFPVYKCGGCGTILQAKYQRNDSKDTGSDICEESSIPTDRSTYGSEDKQLSSACNEMAIPSSEDGPVTLNNAGKWDTSICHNPEQAEEAQFCDGDLNNGKSGSESGNIDVEENGALEEPCLSASVSSPDKDQSSQIGEKMEGQLKEESRPTPDANSVLEANNGEIDSKNDSPRTISGGSSQVTEEGLVEENILASDAPQLSSGEQKEQLQTDVPICRAFERMTSKETFASTEYADPVSEFSDTLGDMSVSPTARSSHAYEGSVSSYDAFEDQYHDRDFHKFKYPGEKMNFVPSKEWRNRGKYQVNDLMSRDSGVCHPDSHFTPSPFSSDVGLYAMKGSRWVQHGMAESSSHVSPSSRYRVRSERDELPPRIPRQPRAVYDHGSPSTQVYPEHDKLKLLKMVYELEDQLKRTCNLDEVASERVSAGFNWQEKHSRMYYGGGPLEESDSLGLNVPGYYRRSEPRNNWRSSKIPFSAEMTKRSYQSNHTHLRHFPPDYRRSEPLPPPNIYNRGLYGFHDTRNPYSPYSSCASSPQRYMDYEPSLGDSETNSNHQRYKIRELNKYSRENHHVVKRHLRPIAGGAPLITCNRCSELLQLPADFLFIKKRCHRLRCGACKAVLKFSVQNRIHIVPYVRDAEAPPPSEADDYDDSTNRRRYSSTSHANGFPHAEPVSCSDDYGLSICKSCSTEGDPALLAQFHALDDRREEKMRFSLNRGQNKQKSLPGIDKSAGSFGQDGKSPDAEELPRRSNSPLHQLMGYCSVSQVFRGPEPSDTGASSSSQKLSGSGQFSHIG